MKADFNQKTQAEITTWVHHVFEKHPSINLEYFQIADEATLLPSENEQNNCNYRAFIAVFINNIRLIDTISLN